MSHSFLTGLGLAVLIATPAVQPLAAQAAKPAAKPAAMSDKAKTAAMPKAMSDDALKDRIAHRLDTNPIVKKYDLKVNVSGGVATVSGDVATEGQKLEAGKLATIKGVTKVNNDVKIEKNVEKTLAERTKSGLAKTGEAITDAWITTKVKWFFVGEDLLKGSDINVDTNNHAVTLKGTVTSAAGKTRAGELAKSTDGVKTVNNELTIARKTTN